MGNLCECVESQPPPEDRPVKRKHANDKAETQEQPKSEPEPVEEQKGEEPPKQQVDIPQQQQQQPVPQKEEANTEPAPQPEPQSEPEPQPEPQSEPSPQPVPQSDPSKEEEPQKTEQCSRKNSSSSSSSSDEEKKEPQKTPEPTLVPESRPQEVTLEMNTQIEAEPEPPQEAESESQQEPEPEPPQEVELEPPQEAESKQEAESESQQEPEPEPLQEVELEPPQEAESKQEAESESQQEAEIEPLQEAEPEPPQEPESQQEPEPQREAEPEPQVAVEVVAEPPPEPEQDLTQLEEVVVMEPVVVEPQAEEGESEEEDQDEVEVAGGSKLLRVFAEGNILTLTSVASEKSLRIVDGEVEGRGGLGKKAQFMVHVRRKRVVALQNVKDSSAWLKIDNDMLSGDGNGDEFCEFQLSQHSGCVALESVKYPGQHVGIKPNGEAKTPSHTGTGNHGRFNPTLIAPTAAGEGQLLQLFETGNIIILNSVSSGKSLRILNKKVDGNGGKGKKARFVVHVRRKGVVSLQNVKDPGAWLRITETQLQGNGGGGRLCEFKIEEVEGSVVLESVVFPGQHVGILPDGEPKPPEHTGRGEHGRFTPALKPEAESGSGVLSRFEEGNKVVLKSKASGKTLRIVKGSRVEGRGGRGALAQFTVHVRGPRVVSLQNVKNPNCWLRIRNNQLQPNGKGGKFTRFRLHEIDGEFVALESVVFPGQHVGILPDGDPKPPEHTGRGEHGRFTPIVIEDADAGDDDDEEED